MLYLSEYFLLLVLKLILINFDLIFSLFLLRRLSLSFIFIRFLLSLFLLALLHLSTHAFLLSMILVKLIVLLKGYVPLGLDIMIQSFDDFDFLKDRHGIGAYI